MCLYAYHKAVLFLFPHNFVCSDCIYFATFPQASAWLEWLEMDCINFLIFISSMYSSDFKATKIVMINVKY